MVCSAEGSWKWTIWSPLCPQKDGWAFLSTNTLLGFEGNREVVLAEPWNYKMQFRESEASHTPPSRQSRVRGDGWATTETALLSIHLFIHVYFLLSKKHNCVKYHCEVNSAAFARGQVQEWCRGLGKMSTLCSKPTLLAVFYVILWKPQQDS